MGQNQNKGFLHKLPQVNNRGMDTMRIEEFIARPENVETYMNHRASICNVHIPDHNRISGVYVLLKLKPPDWSLKDFKQYMDCVFQCFSQKLTTGTNIEIYYSILFAKKEIFFFLDESFDSSDLSFLFSSVIKAPLRKPLTGDETGDSLVQDLLIGNFNTQHYKKVVHFLDSTRETFANHIQEVLRFLGAFFVPELEAIFNMPVDVSEKTMAASCAIAALPNIDLPNAQSKALSGYDYNFQMAYEEPLLAYYDLSHSFISHIKNIIDPENLTNYFASYTFLGQSSSVGKSRLLQSALISDDTALFILYINCKRRGMSGIPKINTVSEKIALKLMECRTEEEMTTLLRNLLYTTFKIVLNKENGQYFLNRPFGSYEPQDLELGLDSIDNFRNELDDEAIWNEIGQFTKNIRFLSSGNGESREIEIIPVIALDEAGCFIDNVFDFCGLARAMNTFRLIRRSLRAKGACIWSCPFIFAGTNTRFGNFVPSASSDPSTRLDLPADQDATMKSLLLFDPYILTSTWDVFAKDRNYSGDAISNWLQYILSNDYMYHLCNYGRPVWGAFAQAYIKRNHELPSRRPFKFPHLPENFDMSEMWAILQVFADQKIGYDLRKGTEEDHIESAVALISLTTGIGLYHSSLVTSLVERRMAFLLDYRYDNGQLLITYPVEPIMSIAALRSFQANAVDIVKNLMSARVFSADNIGEIGEFVIRILFLLCVPRPKRYIPYSSAKNFLRNILGIEIVNSLYRTGNKDALAILNGYISMSSFTKICKMSEIPMENLGLGVMFNAGLCMPNHFPGLDLVIPIVLEDGRLGSINIQAKSYAEKLSDAVAAECISKLSSKYVCSPEIPRLEMLINVTPCDSADVVKILERDGTVVVHIEGLFSKTFPYISEKYDGLKDLLQILLEFGRLERTLKGEKLTKVPLTRDVKGVYNRLRRNSVCVDASDSSVSSRTLRSTGRKRARTDNSSTSKI